MTINRKYQSSNGRFTSLLLSSTLLLSIYNETQRPLIDLSISHYSSQTNIYYGLTPTLRSFTTIYNVI